jgi:hypothetical protein
VRGNGAEYLLDLRPDALWILNHLVRPEAHDPPTFTFHRCRATRIAVDLKRMMIAVDLDHEPPRYAGEVGEVRTDRMLPAKFSATDTPVT